MDSSFLGAAIAAAPFLLAAGACLWRAFRAPRGAEVAGDINPTHRYGAGFGHVPFTSRSHELRRLAPRR